MIRRLVYVAGKFTDKDPDAQTRNVVAAVVEGYRVRGVGAVPVVPHVTILPPLHADPEAVWVEAMAECKALLKACAAVYAIPGWENSRGAKDEVLAAGEWGIPVFFDLGRLQAWLGRTA